MIMSATATPAPNLVQIRPQGAFWTNAWNITNFLFKTFWELTYRLQVRPVSGFSRLAQTTRTHERMCLWGFVDTAPHLGVKSSKTPNSGTWIGVFKPNVPDIKTFILSKKLHRLQPNFAQWQRPPSNRRGWSKYAPKQIQDGGRPPSWKIGKLRCLINPLIDFDEIWHYGAWITSTKNNSLSTMLTATDQKQQKS